MPRFAQPRFRPDLSEEDFIFLFDILNDLSCRSNVRIIANNGGDKDRVTNVLDANQRERAARLFNRFNKVLEDRGYQI